MKPGTQKKVQKAGLDTPKPKTVVSTPSPSADPAVVQAPKSNDKKESFKPSNKKKLDQKRKIGETETAASEGAPVSKKPKSESEKRPATIPDASLFARNLPYGCTAEEVSSAIEKALPLIKVVRVLLVKDVAGQSRGTAFIHFADAECATQVLQFSERSFQQPASLGEFYAPATSKVTSQPSSVLEGFGSAGILVGGRRLALFPALKREQVSELITERKETIVKTVENSRNFHLLKLGYLDPLSAAFRGLTQSEKRQREDGWKERNIKMSNPNFFVSPLRLSVRNLPLTLDSKKLLSAAVLSVSANSPKDAGISKAVIVRDKPVPGERVSESAKSRGFGFIECISTEQAKAILEAINNKPESVAVGNKKSPIVEFAIEDKRKLKIQEVSRKRHAKGARNFRKREEGNEENPKKERKLSRGQRQREKRRQTKAAASPSS